MINVAKCNNYVPNNYVGEDDLSNVLKAVLPIKSGYFSLGQCLQLQIADLESIRKANPNKSDADQALSDILKLWLQKKYDVETYGPPTWRMLVQAVDQEAGGNNHQLAKKIASDHSGSHHTC